jgi:filamentous hemagglutinin
VSAVSGGELDITDDAGQQAKSGKDASMTVALLHRDVHVDEHGNAVDSEGGSTANTIAPIFDAEKVANEIQAQVQITEAFVQQAGQAVETYVQAQRTALQEQLKNATTAAEKSAIKAQMDEVTTQERVMNVLISAVTGMGGAAVTKEGLSIAANQLRQLMIEDSHKFAGVTDGTTVLTNASGESAGVRGDGEKIGGTRIDLDKLCGTSNERCATNADGTLALDAQNRVVWIAEDQDGNPMPLATFLKTDEGKKAAGATGGVQGWIGTLFGKPYEVGSWQDKLIEAFSGTHDFVGGTLSGLYDEQGNATRGRSGLHPLY